MGIKLKRFNANGEWEEITFDEALESLKGKTIHKFIFKHDGKKYICTLTIKEDIQNNE